MNEIPHPYNVNMEAMTLRDHFAGLAMQTFTKNLGCQSDQKLFDGVAEGAYRVADAMLQARAPKPSPPVTVSTIWNKCTVCGLEGVSGVVCYHPQCPTRMTCT